MTWPFRPRWVDAEMQEPWHRDLLQTAATTHPPAAHLQEWAERIAYTYSKAGTLEVTACVLALLDALDEKGSQT